MNRRTFRKIISGRGNKHASKQILLPTNSLNSSTNQSTATASTGLDTNISSLDSRNDEEHTSRSTNMHSQSNPHYPNYQQHSQEYNLRNENPLHSQLNHVHQHKGSSSSTSESTPDYFQMQMELVDLRNRIKLLDNGTSKSELLDLLQEKDLELDKKNEQIGVLNQKFHQITLGLDQMEQERKTLKQKVKLFEEEKNEKDRNLANREKEVQTLQSRCSLQEGKMKEVNTMRMSLQKISIENKKLLKTIDEMKSEADSTRSLMSDLNQVKLEKETLVDEFENMKNKMEIEVGKLRNTVGSQNETIKMYQRREKQLNETISNIKVGQKNTNSIVQQEISKIKDKHNEELKALNRDFGKREVELESKFSKQQTLLTKERDLAVEKMREATNRANSYVRKVEKDANIAATLTSKLNTIEEEKSQAFRKIQQLESDCSSKANVIVALRSEIKEHQEQIRTMTGKLQELTEENSVMDDQRTQLESLMGSLSNLQQQSEKQKDEDESLIESLQDELTELKTSHSMAERTIQQYENELELKRTRDAQLGEKLDDIENLIKSKNKLIAEKDSTIFSLEQKFQTTQQNSSALDDEIKKLKQEKSQANECLLQKQIEFNELKEKLSTALESEKAMTIKLDDMQQKLESSEMQAAEIVNDLEEKLEESNKKRAQLENEAKTMNENSARMIQGVQMKLKESLNDKEKTEKETKKKFDEITISMKEQDREYLKTLAGNVEKITHLETKLSQKESTINTICLQIDKYKKEEVKNNDRIELLKNELNDTKTKYEEELMVYDAEIKLLKSKVTRNENQENTTEKKLKKMKEELDQRTKLLGDLVSHNKELDNDLLEARTVVAELQEELNVYVNERNESEKFKQEKENKFEAMRENLSHEIKKHKERSLHLELQLKQSEESLEASRSQNKELLKKENEIASLKDKIVRQEAYLQRLLQKQKESRRVGKLSGGPLSGLPESTSY